MARRARAHGGRRRCAPPPADLGSADAGPHAADESPEIFVGDAGRLAPDQCAVSQSAGSGTSLGRNTVASRPAGATDPHVEAAAGGGWTDSRPEGVTTHAAGESDPRDEPCPHPTLDDAGHRTDRGLGAGDRNLRLASHSEPSRTRRPGRVGPGALSERRDRLRPMALFQALCAFTHLPHGFRNHDLRPTVEALLGCPYTR